MRRVTMSDCPVHAGPATTHILTDSEGPDPLSDSVRRSDQSLQETNGADQRNWVSFDFIGRLYWFPAAAS